jgi:DNA-binding transcriptional LysR family regulator
MDRLNALEAFVRVVEQGSFVRAAAALGLSTSALSQRVADLESHLGVRLLNRTTRKLSLTESGQALYERAVQVLADLGEAEALASSAAVEPRGTLKITCAHAIGVQRLAPAMAQFHALHPQVRFEVQVSDRMVDLVEEGFDLAIRIGSVVSEQLVARKLGQMRLLPCAAPSYLARHGRPRHPRDLAQHDLLTYAYSRTPQRWVLHGPDGAVHEVRAQGSLNARASCWRPTSMSATRWRGANWCACCPSTKAAAATSGRCIRAAGIYRPSCGCSSRIWFRSSRQLRHSGRRALPGPRRATRGAASPDVSSGTRDLRGCAREPDCATGAQPMTAGGRRRTSLAAAEPAPRRRGRRTNPAPAGSRGNNVAAAHGGLLLRLPEGGCRCPWATRFSSWPGATHQ